MERGQHQQHCGADTRYVHKSQARVSFSGNILKSISSMRSKNLKEFCKGFDIAVESIHEAANLTSLFAAIAEYEANRPTFRDKKRKAVVEGGAHACGLLKKYWKPGQSVQDLFEEIHVFADSLKKNGPGEYTRSHDTPLIRTTCVVPDVWRVGEIVPRPPDLEVTGPPSDFETDSDADTVQTRIRRGNQRAQGTSLSPYQNNVSLIQGEGGPQKECSSISKDVYFYGPDDQMALGEDQTSRLAELTTKERAHQPGKGIVPTQRQNRSGKSFRCELCHKSFMRSWNLSEHRLTHDRIRKRPYVCAQPDCARSFTRKPDLNRHKGIHSNSGKFECGKCHKRFARNDILKRYVLHQGQTSTF